VAGCSIAYHLTLMGWRDIVVVDKGALTGGATFHAAGLIGQLRGSYNLTRMIIASDQRTQCLACQSLRPIETGEDANEVPVPIVRIDSNRIDSQVKSCAQPTAKGCLSTQAARLTQGSTYSPISAAAYPWSDSWGH
jgi:glycine/D-amino acid oxidase-like deaminating enzyme